jgi:hypothetical protein
MSEYNNKSRRSKAQAALETYADRSYRSGMDGEDPANILSDLLCDLRHWAKANNVSFARAVNNSKSNFEEELAEEREP